MSLGLVSSSESSETVLAVIGTVCPQGHVLMHGVHDIKFIHTVTKIFNESSKALPVQYTKNVQ